MPAFQDRVTGMRVALQRDGNSFARIICLLAAQFVLPTAKRWASPASNWRPDTFDAFAATVPKRMKRNQPPTPTGTYTAMKTIIAVPTAILLASLMVEAKAQHIQELRNHIYDDAGFEQGGDVCFRSERDLVDDPQRSIMSVALMGRNVRNNPTGPRELLVLSLRVALRDRTDDLVMHGGCYASNEAEHPSVAIKCLFAHGMELPMQPVHLNVLEDGELSFSAAYGWHAVSVPQQSDGGFDAPPSSDQNLILSPVAVDQCAFPDRFWTAAGTTAAIWDHVQ